VVLLVGGLSVLEASGQTGVAVAAIVGGVALGAGADRERRDRADEHGRMPLS
jgi:hypothetical protein